MQAPSVFPATIDDQAVAEAVNTYRERARELAEARQARVELEQTRALAEDRDREAVADALEAGKPDPGGKHVARHDKRTADALRQEQALELVAARALDAMITTVDTRSDAWGEALQAREQAARAAFLDAIEALTDAQAALADAMATRAWLAGFPDHATYAPMRFASRLRGIPTANGDAIHVAVAVAALRELADPPAPVERPESPSETSARTTQAAVELLEAAARRLGVPPGSLLYESTDTLRDIANGSISKLDRRPALIKQVA